MAEDELDELLNWTDEEWLQHGFSRPEHLQRSRASARTVALALEDYEEARLEAAVARVLPDVRSAAEEALSPERADLRAANARLFGPSGNCWPQTLTEMASLGEEILVEIRSAYRHSSQRTTRAASDVLQSGATTLSAIALLLRHGYVIDGEARWRALHELACTTALLTIDDDPAAIATRYLVHGRRFYPEHQVYREGWATEKFYRSNYEWLRASHSYVDRKGRPRPFTQAWLFENAPLVAAPFQEWVKPSHGPVHLDSATVARGVDQEGPVPAGYTDALVRLVGWQSVCSFYELTCYALDLAVESSIPDERAIAWGDLMFERASACRPSWSIDDPWAYLSE